MLRQWLGALPIEDVAVGARFLWSRPGSLPRPVGRNEALAIPTLGRAA